MKTPTQRPIVCGTDFSKASHRAGDVAAAIAMRLQAPLFLVHGIDERGEIPAGYWPSLKDELRSRLHEAAVRLRTAGATVTEMMADGVPGDGVVSRAERADARFIVLSASRRGAPSRWMLGSVAERIAETSWVPTLVLRDSMRIEDWARGGKPLRVFVGADFTPNAEAALSWAAELRSIGPCEFTVGYVDRFADERAEQVLRAPPDTPRVPEMQEMLKHDLRERVAKYLPTDAVQIRVLPTSGHVARHLLEMAAEAGVDLIVVGTHQWRGLSRLRHPSVSRRLLHQSNVSVACVPSQRVVSVFRPCVSMPRRVVVATDLSTHGGEAIRHAFSVLDYGGTAWLLHVAKPDEASEPYLERLRELIPSDAEQLGHHVRPEVISSDDVATAICEAAERLDADLICVGSHLSAGRPTAVLRSTAHTVAGRSTRPVLIVPEALP